MKEEMEGQTTYAKAKPRWTLADLTRQAKVATRKVPRGTVIKIQR